jgi:hypothetical protein
MSPAAASLVLADTCERFACDAAGVHNVLCRFVAGHDLAGIVSKDPQLTPRFSPRTVVWSAPGHTLAACGVTRHVDLVDEQLLTAGADAEALERRILDGAERPVAQHLKCASACNGSTNGSAADHSHHLEAIGEERSQRHTVSLRNIAPPAVSAPPTGQLPSVPMSPFARIASSSALPPVKGTATKTMSAL